MCLGRSVERPAIHPGRALALDRLVQPLPGAARADALDRGDTDVQRRGDRGVSPGWAAGCLVGLEENAGVSQFTGRAVPRGDPVVEGTALLSRQANAVFRLHTDTAPQDPRHLGRSAVAVY